MKVSTFDPLTKEEVQQLCTKLQHALEGYAYSGIESTVFDICDAVPLYCISIYKPMPKDLIKRIFRKIPEMEANLLFNTITKHTLSTAIFDKIAETVANTYGAVEFYTINLSDLYMANGEVSIAIKDREYLSRFVIKRDFIPDHHHELLRYSDSDDLLVNELD